MTSYKEHLKKIFSNDWVVALVILAVFLLTNRYIYGWDDQHLEIPLLKHLIDPSLYKGDYYVESLKENFTSFLFPLLSKILKVEQIPAAYLTLFVIVRLVFFYWVFRLWTFISGGNRAAAFFCTLAVFMLGRTEEFIYRTFSHQEFSYAFIFAGVYYFYRGRYALAALIFGLSANIHALYSLFPMLYLMTFLLLFQKEKKWRLFLKCAGFFVTAALPFLIWTFTRAVKMRLHADPHLYDNWVELYLLACPQTFLFDKTPLHEALGNVKIFFAGVGNYFFLAALYVCHLIANEDFRRDLRAHAVALMVLLLCVLNFFFTYVVPSHFILDLNLVRAEQYLRFLLVGYTVLLAWKQVSGPVWKVCLLSILLAVCGGKETSDIAVVLVIAMTFMAAGALEAKSRKGAVLTWSMAAVLGALALAYVLAMGSTFTYQSVRLIKLQALVAVWLILAMLMLSARNNEKFRLWIGRSFIIIPFLVAFVFYCHLHYTFVQISTRGGGFWQLQRNWEDMQHYVKAHTPKDALIMAPNDMEMGGFRIHSDRKLLTDYRDCGIIGFDMATAQEWQRRMKDIDAFKVIMKEPFTNALINGIVKYKTDYIVFMKYAAPPDNALLSKLYENEAFVLYKVNRNN